MNKQSQTRLVYSLVIGIIILSLIYLTFISAPEPSSTLNKLTNSGWKVIKTTDSDFNITFDDKYNKNTEICLTLKDGVDVNKYKNEDKTLYDISKDKVDKGKIKFEKNKDNKDSYCFKCSKHCQLGENSTEVEYIKAIGDYITYQDNITVNFQHTRAGIGSNEFIAKVSSNFNKNINFSVLSEDLNPQINNIQIFKLTNISHPFIDYYECNYNTTNCTSYDEFGECLNWENITVFGKDESCGNFTNNKFYEEFVDYNYSYINLTINEQTFKIIETHTASYSSTGLINLNLNGSEFWDKSNSSWWNNTWNYRKNITIDNTNMNSNLTDFPLYVYFNDSDLNQSMPNGFDIRFVLDNGTEAPYERENFSIDAGGYATGYYWVKMDLDNSSATSSVLWIYYGNNTAGAGGDGEQKTSVWSNNFVGVWHFNNDSVIDSTNNSFNGGLSGGAKINTTDCKIGNCVHLDGINDFVSINNTGVGFSGAFTVSFFASVSSYTTYGGFVTGRPTYTGNDYADGFDIDLNNVVTTQWNQTNIQGKGITGNANVKNSNYSFGTWHMGTVNFSVATNGVLFYGDGLPELTRTRTAGTMWMNYTQIGARYYSSAIRNYLNGSMDEVRISNIARTPQWIKFEFFNINESDNELTWGAEQINITDNTKPTITLDSPLNNTLVTTTTNTFNASFSDNVGLQNSTLYIWNSTNSIINNTENRTITGLSNSSNITVVLPYQDDFKWNYYACDNATNSNCNWATNNFTLNYNPSKVGLTILYPTDLNQLLIVAQNQTFNITVNVSCTGGNCGEINVSLDPIGTVVNLTTDKFVGTYNGGKDSTDNIYSGEYNDVYMYAIYEYNTTNITGTINNATLILRTNGKVGTPKLLCAYRINQSWNLSDVQNSSSAPTYDNSICYDYETPTSVDTQYLWSVTDLVKSWINGTYENYGILVTQNVSPVGSNYAYFFGGNNTNTSRVGRLEIDYNPSSAKSGLISTTVGATPFWTNESNPRNITLNNGQSQTVVFWVNATGAVNVTLNHTFFAYANITSAMSIGNKTGTWNVSINTTVAGGAPSDTSYPQFTNFISSPVNASNYVNGAIYRFNSTIENTNGTDGITFNGINYTATNSSNNFTLTVNNLGAGTYSYFWWGYGNGTDKLFNKTSNFSYAINKSIPVGNLTNTTSWIITYPTSVTIGLEEGNLGDADVTYKVYRNTTDLGTGETRTLGFGYYSYTLNTTGGANYSINSTMDYKILEVQKNTTSCNILFNATTPQTYPYKFNVYSNCTSAFYITRNGTIVANNSMQDLSGGYYNFTVYRNDSGNYTNIIDTSDFQITKATPTLTKYLNSQTSNLTINYPQEVNATGIASGGTIKLFRDGTDVTSQNALNISLGAGTYNYEFNITGNANYSGVASQFMNLTIYKATPILTFLLNSQTNNLTITFPQQSNITAIASGGTVGLDKDSVNYLSNNALNVSLPAGTYIFRSNITSNANYSDLGYVYKNFTINRAVSEVNLTLNNSRSNVSIETGSTIDLNCSRLIGDSSGTLNLYNAGTLINSGVSPIGNSTAFGSDGIFNITCIYSQSQNYSSSFETWWVNASTTADTSYPQFTSPLESPAEPVEYSPDKNYVFNITISNTNGTAGIQFNNVNYSMINNSNVFGRIISNLAVGNYTYYYWSFGNGTDKLFNNSLTYSYNVSRNSSYVLSLTGTSPITYPTASNFEGTETNIGDGGCAYQLFINVSSGALSNPDTIIYGVGYYNYTFNTTGCSNYSSNSNSSVLQVTQNSTYNFTITGTTPITYGTPADISNSSCPSQITCVLNRNNTGAIDSPDTSILAVGFYNYTFNTTGNTNYSVRSTSFVLEINQATPTLTFLANGNTANLTITYPQEVNASATANGGTVGLDRDGTNVLSENSLNISLGAGTYTYRANITGNINYSNVGYSYKNITIYKSTSSCSIQFNTTSPKTYPYKFKVFTNCSSASYITRNGTIILNNSEQDLSAGYYNFTVYRNDTSNYTNIIDTSDFQITKATPVITKLLNGGTSNLTITFPQQSNATGYTTGGIIFIYRDEINKTSENGLNVSLSGGTYTYKFNVTGNTNYSGLTGEYMNLTINKATPVLTFLLNSGTANLTITFPQQSNITAIASGGSVGLDKDNVNYLSNNALNVSLSGGTYIFRANITGNINYSDLSYVYKNLTIYKASSLVYTYLNNSRSNVSITQYNSIWLNGTLITGNGVIQLYNESILINNGTSPISNLTNFSTSGIFNVTTIYLGNENYSSSFETWWVNVSSSDTTAPTFTNCRNFTHTMNTSFSQSITATDNVAISNYSLNQTTNFTVNSATGLITNSSSLDVIKLYWLNLTVNDTSNNKANCVFYINVTEITDNTPPDLNVTYPINGSTYSFDGWINLTLNATANDSSGISIMWYNVDNGSNVTFSNTTGIHFEQANNLLKSYSIYVFANDTYNNVNSTSLLVYIQSAPTQGQSSGSGETFYDYRTYTICNEIYSMLLNKTNGNFTDEDLNVIRLNLEKKLISVNLTELKDYIKGYYSKCRNRPLPEDIPIISYIQNLTKKSEELITKLNENIWTWDNVKYWVILLFILIVGIIIFEYRRRNRKRKLEKKAAPIQSNAYF